MVDSDKQTPENNAPSPEVMREDFINLMMGRAQMPRNKAEALVDEMLKRQMGYYAMMAEPEVTDDINLIMDTMTGFQESAIALITAGAGVVQYMNADQQERWRINAARVREKAAQLLQLLV